ncbi:MAG: hypothetical protein KGL39_08925 [Patescibacteria group bacterium]|nr:hypothetical protein [Patescibacteria group bacterium]
MSNYIKTTDFAIKDTYASGDSRKIAKGADVDVEFNNIATAIQTKEDSANKGIANGYTPLNASALITKTFQWTTTAYTDAANTFTAAQIISGSGTLLTITDSNAAAQFSALLQNTSSSNGAGLKILGNGATTPSKTIRVSGGVLQVVNDAYGAVIWSLSDAGAVTATSFSGNGASLSGLNASNINAGSIGSAYVPSGAVTQYQSSMKCRNHPSRGGTNVTLQAGGSPTGGSDGDLYYIY